MNPKQHAKRNTVLRVIAFLLIVALVYGALTRLLTINNATEQQYIRSFYLEPKNSLDVMILGASETFTDYCAPLAWQHAGFTSYPLAVSAAQGTLYASMLRESAKRQNPSVYVVEVNGFLYTEAERDELGTAATREWLDTLPLSRNKVQAIDECVQGDRLSYYVPLLKYHDNWRKPDLIRNSLSLQQQARDAGYSYTKPFLSISMFLTETDEIPVRQQSLDDFNEQSLRIFCETAKHGESKTCSLPASRTAPSLKTMTPCLPSWRRSCTSTGMILRTSTRRWTPSASTRSMISPTPSI